MSLPQDRYEFIDYILRKLGAPVIDINVAEDQIDDRLDEALEFMRMYNSEFLEHSIILYSVTQEDIDRGYIIIPSNIKSIVSILYDGSGFFSGKFGTNIFEYQKNIAYDIGFGLGACKSGTQSFNMMMNYLAELQYTFSINKNLEFNFSSHKLQILSNDWTDVEVGDIYAMECYVIIDEEENSDIWSNLTFINYCTSLLGEQWGNNLSKFNNVELPGGITLDGEGIFNKYHEERMNIEENIQLEHEYPVNFEVG